MRLHTMQVTAFGPFAGTERVDFDALAAAGLFLFTGPTGAGKTSILDAVCFALYGQVPGSRSGTRGLRSDHAADGLAPEVRLEVTLRGRRLRLTRSPQWERPKKRGTGTVTQNAKVLLEELTRGAWTTLSTRLDETGDLVGRLLGLRLAQFCQVVLLPQNQFAEFLRADAEKRRDLLESLFDTRRFAEVERWLGTARQDAARELAAVDQRLERVLARVSQEAGQELPEDLPDPQDWVDGLVAAAHRRHAEAETAAGLATERHAALADELEAASLVADAHARRSTLQGRLVELQAGEAEQGRREAEIAAARRVAPVVPLVTEVARLQIELDTARAAAADVGAAVARTQAGPPGAGTPVPAAPADLTVLARSRRDEAVTLQALARDEYEAERLAGLTDSLEQRIVTLHAASHALARRLDEVPARRQVLEAARDASVAAAAAVPGLTAAAEYAAARLAAARHRDELASRRTALADVVRARTDNVQGARDRWLTLRQARLDGMAAELAGSLHEGDPCPVCGSDEHPRPARSAVGAVTREQEVEAQAAVAVAERALAAAGTALADHDAALAAATAEAGGGRSIAELGAEADATSAALATSASAAAHAEADARAVAAFALEHDGWLREQVALDEEARALVEQAGGERARLAELRAALDAARGDDPSIAARALRLVSSADDLETLGRHVEAAERLGGEVVRAMQRAEQAAADSGVSSLDDVLAAHLPEPELARLDAEHRQRGSELAAVREQLAEPVLVALDGSPAPDLAALRERVSAADADRATALTDLAVLARRLGALDQLAAALRGVLAGRRPAAVRHATVEALSRLAEGKSIDNRLRMSLSGYVLAARLEQVAVAASDRLLRMSSGRYQLVHTDEGATGRSRGGLLLRVLDAWTGVERDPATLSGGESFSASLALALGLADVVTAEAGGTMLETLFVDEGFGSLDEDALDEVMGVLDGLRDGGRTVGLVSHVADLRQRIPVQLQVVKGRHGSLVQQ
jgi:exonuclease SbcC